VTDISIIRLDRLPTDRLVELVTESQATGWSHMRRLVEDWDSGQNRFDGPGEALFAAVTGSRVMGVCGLNADPYTGTPGVGRVRRLYVLAAFRRSGVGRQLVRAVVGTSYSHFHLLRLRTEREAAARFYESLGFQPCIDVPDCTHTLPVGGREGDWS
jgi:GNAT superfamily N-acetyltransferase